ncbi:MAG: hypothetical protein GY906_24060 [bacterium]|nr:hypothetical protein [bacterium]
MKSGLQFVNAAPAGEKQAVAQNFGGQFEQFFPGFTETLLSIVDDNAASGILDFLGEHAELATQFCQPGDVECLRTIALDKGFVQRANSMSDAKNIPSVNAKIGTVLEAVDQNAFAQVSEVLPKDAEGNILLTSATLQSLNQFLPDEVKLSPSELGTIKRNPDILTQFGIKTAEILEAEAKEAIEAPEPTELARLQTERAEAERTGDERALSEIGQAIQKKIQITPTAAKDELPRLQDMRAEKEQAIVEAVAAGDSDAAKNARRDLEEIEDRIGKVTKIVTEAGEVVEIGEKARVRIDVKRQEDAGEKFAQLARETTDLSALLKKVNTLGPGATGVRQGVIELGSGILGQISPELGGRFASLIGGDVSEKDVSDLIAESRVAIAQNITTVTGEESGRFTEMERAVTEATFAVMQALRSPNQIEASLTALLKFKVISQDFQRIRSGKTPEFDLETDDGVGAMADELISLGITDTSDVVDVIERLQRIRPKVMDVFL